MSAVVPDDEEGLRPLMFSIAYRMTGSVAEAEDLAQEALFRLGRAKETGVAVESPKAYLAATTTRLAIDHLRSARARRETYVGTWLPEPIVVDLHESPEQMAELSDSLSMAFLVLLESLSPVERAVFLLREVFEYPYEDIAEVVQRSEVNCRQIFTRARQHLGGHHARYEASQDKSEALLRSFLAAAREGNLEQLVDLLAADAVFYGDGGGKAASLGRPLIGRDRVAEFIIGIFQQGREWAITSKVALVNGSPGFITHDPLGRVLSVVSFDIADGVIQTVRGVVNPDKLRHLGVVSDLLRLPQEPRRNE